MSLFWVLSTIAASILVYTMFGGITAAFYQSKEDYDKTLHWQVTLLWPFVAFYFIGVGIMRFILSLLKKDSIPYARAHKLD